MIFGAELSKGDRLPVDSIERLLVAGMKYVLCPGVDRFPNLSETICDVFDGHGCVISLDDGDETYMHGRESFCPKDILDQLMILSNGKSECAVTFSGKPQQGTAIIALSPGGRIILYRLNSVERFTVRDAKLLGAMWRSCMSIAQSENASIVDEAAIAPRVRQVLNCLLNGSAEKEIAAKLRISRHTVHVYVKDIYRHFGVNSRSELLVRCLKSQPPRKVESSSDLEIDNSVSTPPAHFHIQPLTEADRPN